MPCSLCVSRGVSHLCRWESVPVARPAPARPPIASASPPDSRASSVNLLTSQVGDDLRKRIEILEKTIATQNALLRRVKPVVPISELQTIGSTHVYVEEQEPKEALTNDVTEAAMGE